MSVKYRRDLYTLLPNVSESVCCEIGCAEGYFAADMLTWGIKKLYMIDMWESHPELKGDAANSQEWHNKNYAAAVQRVEKFKGKYQILRGPSAKMADHILTDSVDLVNIDADHSYRGVSNDLRAYWPKLKRGGIISLHDFQAPQYGVKQAVIDFLTGTGISLHLLPEDKMEDAGAFFVKP